MVNVDKSYLDKVVLTVDFSVSEGDPGLILELIVVNLYRSLYLLPRCNANSRLVPLYSQLKSLLTWMRSNYRDANPFKQT